MLVTMQELLKDAQKNRYAVGLFNTITLETFAGVLRAAEALRSPVIIGTAEVLLPFISLEDFAALFLPKARAATVPVAIHFDHAYSMPLIRQAIELGFPSVMYDCSALSYEENAAQVAELTAFAHPRGVTVEAELGHVGTGEILEDLFTDPDTACAYLEQTQADALAIAVGTTHGKYKQPPKLDFDRINAIRQKTDVPLVLHGGSGLTDDDFRRAISLGITKVNIFTDLNCAVPRAMHRHYSDGCGIDTLIPHILDEVQRVAEERMQVFGSAGRA